MLITMINVKGLGGPSSAPAQIKKKRNDKWDVLTHLCFKIVYTSDFSLVDKEIYQINTDYCFSFQGPWREERNGNDYQ